MKDLKDHSLTTHGLAADNAAGRVLLLACGALAREILALKEINGWHHMTLTCLPAIYHITPEKIPNAVADVVIRERDNYEKVFVVYADCGTGGILKLACDALGVEMIEGPHCYSFFEGNDRFSELSESEITSFYLTDFLVRQFDAFVWKPMGLDKNPELRDVYFGNYTKLIYQAQTNDPALIEEARWCAYRLGLEFEHRYTGYGDLETALSAVAKS